MKNIIKASLSIFSVLTLLTACSSEDEINPIIGTVSENEIPLESKLVYAAIPENLEDIKVGAPIESFTGICGEELLVDSAIDVTLPDFYFLWLAPKMATACRKFSRREIFQQAEPLHYGAAVF